MWEYFALGNNEETHITYLIRQQIVSSRRDPSWVGIASMQKYNGTERNIMRTRLSYSMAHMEKGFLCSHCYVSRKWSLL